MGLFLASSLGVSVAQAKPNIVFILADDLGYGQVGAYGQQIVQTPNLDKMSQEGMRFTDYYSGSALCAPARATLMTGLHSGHSPIRNNVEFPDGQLPLPAASITVAELLKNAGYATALVGKWGMGGEGSVGVPTRQGFDYFYGYLDQVHAHEYYPPHLLRGETRVPLRNQGTYDSHFKGTCTVCLDYSDDLLNAEALAFLERSRNQPFFLYYAPILPHFKFQIKDLGPYADRPWTDNQKKNAAMITRLDTGVGKLLAKLKELGLDDSTLVIFAGDNGPHNDANTTALFDDNGPLRGIKGELYEGGVRVPMLARWPGKIASGAATGHASYMPDVLPTLCDLAGVAAPKGIDGISFLPTLLGKATQQAKHAYLYWELGNYRAARMGNWKAVKNGAQAAQLFDLADDLGETRNLAGQNAAQAKQLEDILKSAHTDTTPRIENPTALGDRSGDLPRMSWRKGPGAGLSLDVSVPGEFMVSLYDVAGAELARHSGQGPARIEWPGLSSRGMHFLWRKTGRESRVEKIFLP